MSKTRRALINGEPDRVANYLPSNYKVVVKGACGKRCLIEGEDYAGWTLEGYVLPRLASGLMSGREILV